MPEVSVIIPAFNAKQTILDTIQSLQNQTFQDFELIVIDDGSTDETLEILHQIDDSRLNIFSYENGGVAVARNRGISHSQGEYLSFIDQDDLWTSTKLELQIAKLKSKPNSNIGAIYSWTLNMYEDAKGRSFSQGCQSMLEGNIYAQLLLGHFIGSGSNILVTREAVQSTKLFDPNVNSHSDWDFCLQLARNWDFLVVPENQILYRRTSGSMSSKVDVMEKQGALTIEKAYQSAPPELQDQKSVSLAMLYRYYADMSLFGEVNSSKIKYAREKLIEALRLHPKLLGERYFQVLVAKLLLKSLFPKQILRK